MWLPKWIWERYKELRLKIGLSVKFTFEEAKEILSYDSNQTIYKLLNELEQWKIIKKERSKKDKRTKKYKIVLDLKDIPYSYLSVPSNFRRKQKFLASTGSMAIRGTPIFTAKPRKAFENAYDKKSKRLVIIMPEKEAKTIVEYLIKNIQEYKSPEAILSIIKKHKIDFAQAIKNLNSYQKRYLGALLEILDEEKYKKTITQLYELTQKDKRIFSIFPKKVKKVPHEYKETAKKWRINLNIDLVI
ncbi:hypothetical protein HZC30_08005 [Candidatus Woesearchaeota archaeon]|nr:hypothetical protein [Candidatus Woesearchaeota archaeon]